jgi:hypothetical protein
VRLHAGTAPVKWLFRFARHWPAACRRSGKPLLAQWRERLATHLGVDAGQIGVGKQSPTKIVDIAMVQTVTRNERAADLLDGYGLVVIDECHHVPAPTVERAVRNLDARRWLGLTATPQRPDGLKVIMVMQCGPIRHRITQGASDLDRRLQVHRTELTIDDSTDHHHQEAPTLVPRHGQGLGRRHQRLDPSLERQPHPYRWVKTAADILEPIAYILPAHLELRTLGGVGRDDVAEDPRGP